jgi:hypothetical protein
MNHAIDLLSAGKDVPEGPRPIVRLPFAAIGTSQRCADFPHFNVSLQFAHGGSKTAHIYHTPYDAPKDITVVMATVGSLADNMNRLISAFAPHGMYFR